MIILNTNKGRIKINPKLLTLTLSLTTSLTLTGCSEEKTKKELEVKKWSYTEEQVNELSSNKKYKIETQADESKVVVRVYDRYYGYDINNPERGQIEDVKLKVTDSDNSIVDIFTTTENNEYVLKNITPDEYTIEVVSVPEEYEKPTELYSFTIEDTKVIEDSSWYTVNYIDIPLENKTNFLEYKVTDLKSLGINEESGVIVVSSVDKETNDYVPGGKYTILDDANNNIVSWTATDESFIALNLTDGEYIVKEIQPPEGFLTNTEEKHITIEYGKAYLNGNKNREVIFKVEKEKNLASGKTKKLTKTK